MRTELSSTPKRHHLDLGADYLLRSVAILSQTFGGDVSRALVYLAALQASSQHLRNPRDQADRPLVIDDQRRPVSLSCIARSLAMSVETTRRHVLRLEQDGMMDRTANGGVRVRFSTLDCAAFETALAANSVNILRLADGLRRLTPATPPTLIPA